MTGNTNKVRALFLSALMVLSVFAGTIALSGAAAANAATDATVVDATEYNSGDIEIALNDSSFSGLSTPGLNGDEVMVWVDGENVTGDYSVDVDGSSVGEVLQNLAESHPDLRDRIFDDEGSVRRFVNVFANDEDIRFQDQLDTELSDGDQVSIVPAIAGG